ncbi:hypothetical protein MF6394_18045 [Pseudomonas sp. MF6394]|nr:hypothetical protein MF6394_18045 [Pseudomonas sp. MF6394]
MCERGVLPLTKNKCGSKIWVGAGLARDAGTSVIQPDRGDAIAGKPAPTQARTHFLLHFRFIARR